MKITKEKTVKRMVESLLYQAKEMSLQGLSLDGWQDFLDDKFCDEGQIRCEQFSDLSMEYGLQFGEFESEEFLNACWDCCITAIGKIIDGL